MYSEIYVNSVYDGSLTFAEAFEQLKEAYIRLAKLNSKKYLKKYGKDFERTIQIEIVGRGAGTFHVRFTPEEFEVIPWSKDDADATITASFDHLIGMTTGEYSADRLFINGQMKVRGNIAKGAQMRSILMPRKRPAKNADPE